MPLTLIKEDGTGLANANTYADVADADAFHEGHLYASAWTAATLANKEKALVLATRLIDGEFQFNGWRASGGQMLQWPRVRCPDPDADPEDGDAFVGSGMVPRCVVWATCEMAREVLLADRTGTPAGEGMTLQRLADQSEIIWNKRDRRPVISLFAQSLLCKYGAMAKRAKNMTRLERV
jgi:hypothetical protein